MVRGVDCQNTSGGAVDAEWAGDEDEDVGADVDVDAVIDVVGDALLGLKDCGVASCEV